MPRRTVIVLAVIGVVSLGLAVVAAWPHDGGSTAGSGVDWSAPADLPSPEATASPQPVGDGVRWKPTSGRVIASQAYRFDTGHCGLGYIVDFDGSFWTPVDPGSVPEGVMHHEDVGAIALVDFDRAVYRASDGTEVPLERVNGSVTTSGSCA